MSEHSYTLDHYIDFIERARARDFTFVRLCDIIQKKAPPKFILIRHDVDITPWAALAMAEAEGSLGVHASYYYRLHATTYNFMTKPVLETVRRVMELGHEVGLHYEPGFFAEIERDPVAGVQADLKLFEEILGIKTQTIAQHQPAQGPLLTKISPRHRCAYEPEFVRDIPYFADSGSHWREGCICTKLESHSRIHTLIHPHSWMYECSDWRDVLRSHADELAARMRAEMEAYIHSVEEYLKRRPGLDRAREALYNK